MKIDLSGTWTVTLKDQKTYDCCLPGTLDENGIGDADEVARPWHPDCEDREKKNGAEAPGVIVSRFTRKHTYEGPALFAKRFEATLPEAVVKGTERVFLRAERSRALSLKINGHEVPAIRGSLSTPYVFEVTGLLQNGSLIELISDNSYPGLPYQDILYSSAATDETQTNWNGIIGEFCIETKPSVFIRFLNVYPKGDKADVSVSLDLGNTAKADPDLIKNYRIRLSSEAFATSSLEKNEGEIAGIPDEKGAFTFHDIPLSKKALEQRWDEYAGNLFEVTATLQMPGVPKDAPAFIAGSSQALDTKTVSFGIRDFGSDESGRLTINRRRFFLRGEANCAVFPETGHPPVEVESWEKIIGTYASYGVNVLRFHSWCPPEAAFSAADQLGIMVQPELSNWNPRTAFSTPESRTYYETKIWKILKQYGNHPSFVMLTLGNELHTDEDGVKFMHRLLATARSLDPTRLFAWGSNNFYGTKGPDPESDFYTASDHTDGMKLRASGVTGLINSEYPHCTRTFEETLTVIRKTYQKPVFGFEVGQTEVLPEFSEFDLFQGVTDPRNLKQVQTRLREAGVSDDEWTHRVAASGELSLLCYREEVESVLRTPSMSGLSLLGLQDFPGQGTALVGMLNSHLLPKPYPFAKPERFRAFFRETALLALLPKYTFVSGETLTCEIRILNYGNRPLSGDLKYKLSKAICTTDCRTNQTQPVTEAVTAGTLKKDTLIAPGTEENLELTLPLTADTSTAYILELELADLTASYPLWVYADKQPVKPDGIYETAHFDDKTIDVLRRGGTVYLTPPSTPEALPGSAKAQFSTDFWSVGTFPSQEGTMGQLIDAKHPLFNEFPTEDYTNYQWYPMASARALVLPEYLPAIVAEMDSYATLRPMAQLLEGTCLQGKILISSFGLQDLQEYPEARALLSSIYRYMISDDFAPSSELPADLLKRLVP